MLQRLGDSLKGKKWLAYVVLLPLAAVFAVWGAAGIVNMDFFGAQSFGAKVNGTKIAADELTDAWREQQSQWQQRFGGDIPEATRKLLQDNLVESFVRNALIADRTRDLGYRVTDQRVREYIEGETAFQLDGKYNEQVAVSRLAQLGLSTEKFKADVRTSLQNAELQRAIQISDFLTPLERANLFRIEDEQREVRYALLPVEKFAGAATPDEAAIAEHYKRNAALYMLPETVRLQYAELRLAQVAASVTVAESDLQDLYAKNRDRYANPERRRARHILVAVSGGNDAAALKKAEGLLAQAQAGKDFAQLASGNSDDSGSAAAGGDLGWSDRSAFVGPFADAVFSMKDGETRGPVKTQFGYHIIRLDGIQAGGQQSYEQARGELEAEFRRDRSADIFGERQEAVQRKIEAPGANLDDLAKEFGLATGVVESFARVGGGAPLGADPILEDLVFGDAVLNQRLIGGPITLGEDRFVLVKVLEHRKAAPQPLAAVRDQIITAIRAERATAAASAAGAAALQRLTAGEPYDAVLKSLGVASEAARFIGRADPSVPAQVREAVFAMPRPAPIRPAYRVIKIDTGGAALVAVTQSRSEPPDTSNPQLLLNRLSESSARSGAGDVGAYVQQLRSGAKVEKNDKVFE